MRYITDAMGSLTATFEVYGAVDPGSLAEEEVLECRLLRRFWEWLQVGSKMAPAAVWYWHPLCGDIAE